MPELPEVETTKASLSPLLGHTLTQVQVHQPKLRWQIPDNLSSLQDHRLHAVHRRAKYLLLDFVPASSDSLSHGDSLAQLAPKRLIIHLGMSGSLQQHPQGFSKRKHDHVLLYFASDQGQLSQLHYHDPRRFGAVLWHHDFADKLLTHLGVEPLDSRFDGQYLYQRIKGQQQNSAQKRPIQRPIKTVIMDQQIVVGVGNIYATESLFLAGIHPATPAHLLTQTQLSDLVRHIKAILSRAIAQGGSSLRDFTTGEGKTGYFQQTLLAYGRMGEPCVTCQTPLDNLKLLGRASVFCPVCQPIL